MADRVYAHPLSRRRFLEGLAGVGAAIASGSLLAACGLGPALGTQPRVYRVAYLSTVPPSVGLLEGLAEHGYVEGTNLVFEPRIPRTADETLALAAELVRTGVDCIVARGAAYVAAAQATAGTSIPVVGISFGDPVQSGLVASLGRPGGNLTGVTYDSRALDVKGLQVLKEAVPGLTRVAIFQGTSPTRAPVEQWLAAGDAMGLQVRLYEVTVADADGMGRALETAVAEGADGLHFSSGPTFTRNRALIVDFLARSRLPALYSSTDLPPEGALMSFGPDEAAMARRAAALVDKVLHGINPGDIPVEQMTRYELVLNLKTAEALGLMIPQSVLIQATEIIR